MEVNSPSHSHGQSAAYGKACKDCSRAKSRCNFRAPNEPCERCRRLNKTCVSQKSVRSRNGKASASIQAAQASQLTSKIDGLVSLLTSVAESSPTRGLPNTAYLDSNFSSANHSSRLDSLIEALISKISVASSSPPQYPFPSRDFSGSSPHSELSRHGASQSSPGARTVVTSASKQFELSSASTAISYPFSGFQPSLEQDEEYFQLFRAQFITYLPFVDIQSCQSAKELRQERPFLFRVITAIASPSNSRKLALGREIREELATQILIENNDSVDFLLGLLAFVTWGHDQFSTPLNLSRFTQLAISLVYDLRLNKPAPNDLYMISAIDAGSCDATLHAPPTRTLDERRAVLACFVLSSNVSLYFGKIDALRWTTYMNECLQILTDSKECSGDTVLVIQVRLQLLTDRVAQAISDVNYGWQSSRIGGPPSLFLKMLHSDLDGIKRSIPLELQNNKLLLGHIFNTELSINEMGISKNPSPVSSLRFHQLEPLYACLNSIKSWFDIFFELPLSAYVGISFPFFAQLGHCVVALYRLSTLEEPGWDKDLLTQTADLLQILDRIIDNIKRVEDSDNGQHKRDMFTRTIQNFQVIRARCGLKLGENRSLSNVGEDSLGDLMADSTFMGISGDAWLKDALGSWDYGYSDSF